MRDEPTRDFDFDEAPSGKSKMAAVVVVGGSFMGLCLVIIISLVAIAATGTNANQTFGQVANSIKYGDRAPPRSAGNQAADAVAGTAVATGAVLLWLVIVGAGIAWVVSWIMTIIWVAKDSHARGMDGGAMWVIVMYFTGMIGLLVYLGCRPVGVLAPCIRCGNRKLALARACPHCGDVAVV